jgi:hypothetical protein
VPPALARIGAAGLVAAAAALLPAASAAAVDRLEVTAKPGLVPTFQPGVIDYVSGCRKGRSLRLSIATTKGDSVSVDGAGFRSGSFKATVSLDVGQSTALVARSGGKRKRYHVRCLPSSFPHWKFTRFARPQAQWWLFAPVTAPANDSPRSRYVIFMDSHGVPVWWRQTGDVPFASILLPSGDVAWTRWYGDPFGMRTRGSWEVHRLDGTRIRTLRTKGSPIDTHDMEPLSNGHYLLDTYRLRRNVDLGPCGGPAQANVVDGEIQEVSSTGARVWSWSSKDHVSPCEAQSLPADIKTFPDGTKAYDYFHLNSVEPDGNGLVISARHVSAVYRIGRPSGKIEWKLGGKPRPESLRVTGDPLLPTLDEQHDARVLGDGTITVYDNRSHLGPPRAVRFRIDPSKHTASFVEQVTDPKAQDSGSEGSARRLVGGDWVVTWGETNVISEISRTNALVARLELDHAIDYRTQPVPYGRLKASTLRRAMDRMFPRGP